MNRQSFIRVLLSLLLLLSQQMAMSHALSHWTGTLDGTQQLHQVYDGDLSSAYAQDESCSKCLGFAQLGAPLSSTPRMFVSDDLVSSAVVANTARAACARTVCMFESRAPPQA
jgi:hypothetical protein